MRRAASSTIIAALAFVPGIRAHAGPRRFAPARLTERARALSAGNAPLANPPTTVSARGQLLATRQVTGSLRVTFAGLPPLVFPGGTATVLVLMETPGSLPKTFTLPPGFIVGTEAAGPVTPYLTITGVLLSARASTITVKTGGGSAFGNGQVFEARTSNGWLCLLGGAGPCVQPAGLVPIPAAPIGVGGTLTTVTQAGISGRVAAQTGWITGLVSTRPSTIFGGDTISAYASGSRSANSISLVTAFVLSSNSLVDPLPGVARLHLNFRVPGATTTTTLPPGGGDVGVDARKLVVVDKLQAADKAKVVFVAKDQVHGIAKGPGTDPDAISATLDVAYTGTAGRFVIPAGALDGDSGWKTNKDTVAKFVNKAAPDGPTGAKVAVIKPNKLLKLVGKSLGDTPIDLGSPPDAAGVDVAYTVTNGGTTTRHCTRFPQDACGYKVIAAGSGHKLVCKGGMAASCTGTTTTTLPLQCEGCSLCSGNDPCPLGCESNATCQAHDAVAQCFGAGNSIDDPGSAFCACYGACNRDPQGSTCQTCSSAFSACASQLQSFGNECPMLP